MKIYEIRIDAFNENETTPLYVSHIQGGQLISIPDFKWSGIVRDDEQEYEVLLGRLCDEMERFLAFHHAEIVADEIFKCLS